MHAALGGTKEAAGDGSAPFPPGLAKLLDDPRVLLVGVGVKQDMKLLARHYPGAGTRTYYLLALYTKTSKKKRNLTQDKCISHTPA